ncbi:MAG: FMN-binding negative transcriptional regulator [Tissierellia bacterium]|nr:FMN-binding negative transcriptional regulator [Tissierellia bacterium]
MRRKDREVALERALEIIDESMFGVVASQDYALPLSLAREGNTLYAHSAKSGEKWEHWAEGTPVTVVFVAWDRVPHPHSKEELLDLPNNRLPKVFTTNFASAMVRGKIRILDEVEERRRALYAICKKYMNDDEMELFDRAFNLSDRVTAVYAIDMESVTGKVKE